MLRLLQNIDYVYYQSLLQKFTVDMLWEQFIYNPEPHGSYQVDPAHRTEGSDEFIFLLRAGRSEEKLVDRVSDTDKCGGSQYKQGVPRLRACGEEGKPQQSYSHVLEIILTVLLAPTDPHHLEGSPDSVETELSPR